MSKTNLQKLNKFILKIFALSVFISLIILFVRFGALRDDNRDKDPKRTPTLEEWFELSDLNLYLELLHLDEVNSFPLATAENIYCMDLNGSLDASWIRNFAERYNQDALKKGITELDKKRGERDYFSFLYLCMNESNYYVSYTTEKLDLNTLHFAAPANAASGLMSTSVARIDTHGALKIVNNVETSISDYFKELSFYFNCRHTKGIANGQLLMLCSGTEGDEATIGLISVDFDSGKKEYINYCINPLENLQDPFNETDLTYTCYEKLKKIYYKGTLDDSIFR